jgi:maltose O-acetyltransferase
MLIALFNLSFNLIPTFFFKRHFLGRLGIHLAKGAVIHRRVYFFSYGNITIGENSTVNPGCYLDNRNQIIIGKNVSIAHDARIYTLGHDIDSKDFALKGADVHIHDYVCIFANAMIMPGVTLNEGAVVYPGSVVTKSVAPYTVVGGNPARVLRERSRDLQYNLNTRFWFMI